MRNKKKTNYIILIIIILVILLLAGTFMLTSRDSKSKKDNTDTPVENIVSFTKEEVEDTKEVYYYICSDDESTLSVRDSEGGSRIDMLACGSKVSLISISDVKSDICDSWYYVSYTKYTSSSAKETKGYVCGTYLAHKSENLYNEFSSLDLSQIRIDTLYVKINDKYNITTKRDGKTLTLLINDYNVLSNKASCMGTIMLMDNYLVVSNNDSCGDVRTINLYNDEVRLLDTISVDTTSDNILDLTYTVKKNKLYYKVLNYEEPMIVDGYTIKECSTGNYNESDYSLDLNHELGKLYEVSISEDKFLVSDSANTYTLSDYIDEVGKDNICISK